MKYEIDCVHFNACSGCTVNSCQNPPQLFQRAKEYFENSWQISLGYSQGAITGWRCRAKLAAREPDTIGLFAKGTHAAINIPHCKVHNPKINEAISQLKKLDLPLYNEKNHTGELRYVQCVVERSSGKVQLVFVLNMPGASSYWQAVSQQLFKSGFWHSIWCNYNSKKTNTIFGPKWEKMAGSDALWEEVAGYKVAFGPSHFGQANLEMYEELIYDLKSQLLPNKLLVELYAGIGTIGLCCADACKAVCLSEQEATAEHYFMLAKNCLSTPLQQKLTYKVAKAEECLKLIDEAEVVIVDPPRKGLQEPLLNKIATAKQLLYVSCDYSSLERDLEYIRTHHPHFRVEWAKCYLFFPGTEHIETLVSLKSTNSV